MQPRLDRPSPPMCLFMLLPADEPPDEMTLVFFVLETRPEAGVLLESFDGPHRDEQVGEKTTTAVPHYSRTRPAATAGPSSCRNNIPAGCLACSTDR